MPQRLQAGRVSGRITGPEGDPVAGAAVHLDTFVLGGELGPWNAVSGADGQWAVEDPLLFGNVRVTASKTGLIALPQHRDLFFDLSATADFLMDTPGISGTVRAANGSALPGVVVSAVRTAGGAAETLSTVADAAGRYRIRSDTGLAGTWSVVPLTPTVLFRPSAVVVAGQEITADFTEAAAYDVIPAQGMSAIVSDKYIWGDANADGLADAMILGGHSASTETLAFARQGPPVSGARRFSVSSAPAPVRLGDGIWRDFNNDGALDFAVIGLAGSNFPALFVLSYNAEANTWKTEASYNGLSTASIAAGDVDNDGRTDLLTVGTRNATGTAILWRNAGPGFHFVPSEPFQGGSAASLVDFDTDGDLDAAVTGRQGITLHTSLYRNNGSLNFTLLPGTLPAGEHSHMAWGDWDADGLPDAAIAFSTLLNDNYSTNLYRNIGAGNLTLQTVLPRGQAMFSLNWGDLDGDGAADLLTNGLQDSVITRQSGGALGDIAGPPAGTNPRSRHGAWVDIDGDGALEIALTRDAGAFLRLFRCPVQSPNAAPAAPAGLSASFNGTSAAFAWAESTDDRTPAAALTYNLRVGTTPGGVDIVSPMADVQTGRRRIWERGSIEGPAWTLRGLTPGRRYYWSVQAIDASFAGGAWAAEQSFGPPEFNDLRLERTGEVNKVQFSGTPGLAWRVQFSGDLVTWLPRGTAGETTQGSYLFTETTSSVRGFYRVLPP